MRIHFSRAASVSLFFAVAAPLATSFVVSPARAQASRAADYKLGPDDVISIVVARHPEMSVESATVPTSGRVTIPEVGEIVVTGKTVAQVRTLVIAKLRRVLKRPEASVSLKAQRKRSIVVLGASVNAPGNYNAAIGWRVLDALAAAGGLKTSAELVNLELIRANGRKVPINVVALQAGRVPNSLLQAGDRLVFSSRTISVTIAGQVSKPGTFELSPDGGLAELIAQAGGPLPAAALTRVSIKRADGTVVPMNLRAQPDANPKLRAGDLVVVPQVDAQVVLSGSVAKPGIYDLEDGRTTRIADLLAQAGGATAPLDTLRIVLQRSVQIVGANGQTENNFSRTPTTRDRVLQDGDIVEVTPIVTKVTITGEVKQGGAFDVRAGEGLAELIARAGGPTELAMLTRVVVGRNGQNLEIDAYDAVKNGKELDFPLQDGDLVTLRENTARIFVSGAVNKSGYLAVPERGLFTLGDALTEAGGTASGARLSKIGLFRNGGKQKQEIDLKKRYEGRIAVELPLQRGDVVFVPEPRNKRSVFEQAAQALPFIGLLFR